MAGLRVKQLLESGVMPDGKAVGLFLLGVDGRRYELQVEAQCAPAVATAILREAGRIQTSRPADSEQDGQILTATGLQGAVLSTGGIGLVLTLEGGSELVFSLPRGVVAQVADMLRELDPADRPRN